MFSWIWCVTEREFFHLVVLRLDKYYFWVTKVLEDSRFLFSVYLYIMRIHLQTCSSLYINYSCNIYLPPVWVVSCGHREQGASSSSSGYLGGMLSKKLLSLVLFIFPQVQRFWLDILLVSYLPDLLMSRKSDNSDI